MRIELLGGTSREELEKRIQVVAAAGKLSRFPGNVFEAIEASDDYEKNLKMIKRIIKMGHKSIIEHDYFVFAISDVTPIVEQTIIGNRLTSFTIKSRREVDFRNVGFIIPNFRDKKGMILDNNEFLRAKYAEHMKFLFDEYARLVDAGVKAEDARFILPYSFYSNIIMGLDARELERMINYLMHGEVSNIVELHDLGEKLAMIAKEYIPYLSFDTSIDHEKKISSNLCFEFLKEEITKTGDTSNSIRPYYNPLDRKPILVDYPYVMVGKGKHMQKHGNADEIVLLRAIMNAYQCTESGAQMVLNYMHNRDSKFENKFMEFIMNKEEVRELEQVSFTFQIPISLSVLTHLTRHRMHSLLVPSFVPLWKFDYYIVPPSILHDKYASQFKNAVERNEKFMDTFRKCGVCDEDLVYFYLGCQMCNVVTTMNARALQWISRMRCCTKAQWQIRNIVNSMVEQVKKVAPLIGNGLGPTCVTSGFCNEGKESCGKINNLKKNKS